MRSALTTALMVVAALAFADEPNAPAQPPAEAAATKTEAAAEATPEKPAAQLTATEAAATAAVAEQEEDKPFKPPAGYRSKRVDGKQVYCTKVVVLGSRFPKEDCRTEAQLRELELRNQEMRGDIDSRNRLCAGGGACQTN